MQPLGQGNPVNVLRGAPQPASGLLMNRITGTQPISSTELSEM
jgi:hypothetical protein